MFFSLFTKTSVIVRGHKILNWIINYYFNCLYWSAVSCHRWLSSFTGHYFKPSIRRVSFKKQELILFDYLWVHPLLLGVRAIHWCVYFLLVFCVICWLSFSPSFWYSHFCSVYLTLCKTRSGMMASVTTLHPSQNVFTEPALPIEGQSTAMYKEPWLTPNQKLQRAPKCVRQIKR